MMGSAATKEAAARRAEQRAAKLANAKAKLDARLARSAAKTGNIEIKGDVALLRAQTESQSLLAPIASQSQVDVIDTEARAKLVRALPWIIGGVVVIGAVVFLRKRAKARAS